MSIRYHNNQIHNNYDNSGIASEFNNNPSIVGLNDSPLEFTDKTASMKTSATVNTTSTISTTTTTTTNNTTKIPTPDTTNAVPPTSTETGIETNTNNTKNQKDTQRRIITPSHHHQHAHHQHYYKTNAMQYEPAGGDPSISSTSTTHEPVLQSLPPPPSHTQMQLVQPATPTTSTTPTANIWGDMMGIAAAAAAAAATGGAFPLMNMLVDPTTAAAMLALNHQNFQLSVPPPPPPPPPPQPSQTQAGPQSILQETLINTQDHHNLSLHPHHNLHHPHHHSHHPIHQQQLILAANGTTGTNGQINSSSTTPSSTSSLNNTSSQIVKEVIHCKSCTLYPPTLNAPPPTTRERPPGCRTVFVGGLPEGVTEDTLQEVFERCGEISTLRLSKKNFCHIRFIYEGSVDAAIFLSGYRMRLNATNSNTSSASASLQSSATASVAEASSGGSGSGGGTVGVFSGRLHVDYAQARDDQFEFECRQRQLQREQRHRVRLEEERLRPPSPPPVIHYTDHEAAAILERIKQDETFAKAILVVITWLERGDCNKRNANCFYSMIQSTNSHVRRLLSEKGQYEEDLRRAREILKGRMQGILLQFSQIERLFVAACHKKVWDHFTKAQRKNIETWKKLSKEMKNIRLDEPAAAGGSNSNTNEQGDDEMEVSDDDSEDASPPPPTQPPKKRPKNGGESEEKTTSTSEILREENAALQVQIGAYRNEVDVLKAEHRKQLDDKAKQFEILQQTLQRMQQQLLACKQKQIEDEATIKELFSKTSPGIDEESSDGTSEVLNVDDVGGSGVKRAAEGMEEIVVKCRESDARIVAIVSAFLNVHPFGAGLDYIWSYVNKFEVDLRPADIETLMGQYPSVFKQELVGIGANIERRWMFNAFTKI